MPALKRIVANIEDVAEPLRALYAKQADGAWRLEVDGDEDVTSLKSALQKERDSAATLDRELKKLRKDIDGLDPEKARAALARVQELEEKKMLEAGEVDKVIAQRTAALQADHQNQIKTFQQQLEERDGQLKGLTGQLRTLTLDGSIRELAAKKGVRPEAIQDAIARFTVVGVGGEEGKPPIKWDYRDGKVVALRGDDIVYGKDATRPMSFDEGFAILQTEAKHLFGDNAGANALGGAGQVVGTNVVLTPDQARNPQQYRQAREAAAKQGGTVVVQ